VCTETRISEFLDLVVHKITTGLQTFKDFNHFLLISDKVERAFRYNTKQRVKMEIYIYICVCVCVCVCVLANRSIGKFKTVTPICRFRHNPVSIRTYYGPNDRAIGVGISAKAEIFRLFRAPRFDMCYTDSPFPSVLGVNWPTCETKHYPSSKAASSYLSSWHGG